MKVLLTVTCLLFLCDSVSSSIFNWRIGGGDDDEDIVDWTCSNEIKAWVGEKIKACHDKRKNMFKNNNEPYDDANKITEQLWIGNICAAANRTFLIENNISYVINMASEWRFSDFGWPCIRGANSFSWGLDEVVIHVSSFKFSDSFMNEKRVYGESIGQLTDSYNDKPKDVIRYFDMTSTRLQKLINEDGRNVMVVCNVGKSQSVSAVIRYLMDIRLDGVFYSTTNNIPEMELNYEVTLDYIKRKRLIAQPIRHYERILTGHHDDDNDDIIYL
jgi:hypothetical protein